MARQKSRTLTDVELEFMKIVWSADEVTAEDVRERLGKQDRDLADGSVRKVLSILGRKGYLVRRRQGRAFLYKATVPENQANRSLVGDLLRRAFGGSAALLVAALLDTRDVERKDVEKIRELIARRLREEKP